MYAEGPPTITAVLGPTNTGKTHRAIERMLDHPSGMMGLPLRLLAREVYDRVTTRIGERAVALVTGEEKRVPPGARYWICTVEAMPVSREVDFVAVDEIQLAAHAERGHVFTERLLHARGRRETWFLGADTMRAMVERLVPTAQVKSHPRLSSLLSTGASTLGGLRPRSAVVAFSAAKVYEVAERLRERRGGAAVVLGALSPRARNAQVALYQSGEVDYLVATDAIGMGLNLDVLHVAFAETRKFDGRESRSLETPELAQIAGRAGRYLNDGSFGTLLPQASLPDPVCRAIEHHAFPQVTQVYYRNVDLDFGSVPSLVQSLRLRPRAGHLRSVERADDLAALEHLALRPDVQERLRGPEHVELLWEVCRVPDFRGLMLDHHVELLHDVFLQLSSPAARLDADFLHRSIGRIDDVEGDIETLLARMAKIRTFTYISHREGWVPDAAHFQELSRAVEDRLSDALHDRLVARFVDRGAARRGPRPLGRARRRSPRGAETETEVDTAHPFGKLRELRERLTRLESGSPEPLDEATEVEALVSAPHERFHLDAEGRILDEARVLARLVRGQDLLHPEVTVTVDTLGSGERSRLQRRLVAWTRDLVADMFGPLRARTDEVSAAVRGVLYQLEQSLGTLRLERGGADPLAGLTPAERDELATLGVRVGRLSVYVPSLLLPEAVGHRLSLLRAHHGHAPRIPEGASCATVERGVRVADYATAGFPAFGPRAIRADVAERLRTTLRRESRRGPFVPTEEIRTLVGGTEGELPRVLGAFDYRPVGRGRFAHRSASRRAGSRA